MFKLKEKLEAGEFVITSEIAPPKGPDLGEFIEKAKLVQDRVVAINVTDNQRAIMRLSSLVASAALEREGIESIYQLACRDRNRLALQSDLLGAHAFGIRNVLPLTGDAVAQGDQKDAKPVFEMTSVKLMALVQKLNQGLSYNDHPLNGKTEFFVGGAVDPKNIGAKAFFQKMEEKMKYGAEFFQSQPVYDLDLVEKFFRYAEEHRVKSLIGVLLVKGPKQAAFLNSHVPGIRIPDEIIHRFNGASEPLQVGIDFAARQIRELRPLSHGIHIMTVGREDLVPEILNRAGL
ncbi:MAG TPA: 5,10-methylenetetrahydrofolate reductase [Deltaproteobacteria bacterium]|nr:5,10-methylenetetrahydrofolate reductase [Deltaproteobacteria bacterium]